VLTAAALAAAVAAGAGAWRRAREPRAWEPAAVPVAFWSWRDETPAQDDVDAAAATTGARTIFLRAGQMDFSAGRVERVRAVRGRFPAGVALHLVYNATPSLLEGFERVGEDALAAFAVETFRADAERAAREGARVEGLQLDLDVPTRLLARYGRVLRAARALLPAGTRLSVTGLPTWMNEARELKTMLGAADFWSPQFYGAEIPERVERVVPVSSPREVERGVEHARELGVPFYAGLAAYGHAILYSTRGRLVELRGDLDPARVAADQNFELVERRAFEPRASSGDGGTGAAHASEWRYVFRARGDTGLDGLAVRAGDTLVLDMPSGEALRAGARGVRLRAGDKLLGICLFRLPTRGDPTALNLEQLASALADREARVSTRLAAADAGTNQLLLTAANDGAAGALLGDDAFSITLRLPNGGLRGLTRLEGFESFETLCAKAPARPSDRRGETETAAATLHPCSTARAGFLRLRTRSWPGGARAVAGLSFEGGAPASLTARVAVRADDGRLWERELTLKTNATKRAED
jgi:hypothetical protein